MSEREREATDKIQQLRGVVWEWRDDAPEEAKEQPGMGVIAQEVEAVFPDLVETDEHGVKRVAYHGLIAPLIEAVKELDNRMTALEEQLRKG
jgi:trimeric autotransporter adhesin